MGRRNFLVEGVSCSGKTAVATELQRRGHHVVHGDRELKYRGDPRTGAPLDLPASFPDDRGRAAWISEHLCWPAEKVAALVADDEQPVTFFCGGSRNSHLFLHLFDAVFVLDVDRDTLGRRLDARPGDEWGGKGRSAERELVLRLHRTKQDLPAGIVIDATAPLARVVDEILRHCDRYVAGRELARTRPNRTALDAVVGVGSAGLPSDPSEGAPCCVDSSSGRPCSSCSAAGWRRPRHRLPRPPPRASAVPDSRPYGSAAPPFPPCACTRPRTPTTASPSAAR